VAGQVSDVTDETFETEVLESETAVLVDFWAPWCGPCRVVSPILEEINAERDDLRVVKLNVDDNQVTAVRFEVLSIPTMILFRNGQAVKKVIGAQRGPAVPVDDWRAFRPRPGPGTASM
jgi:thioredoxin 1